MDQENINPHNHSQTQKEGLINVLIPVEKTKKIKKSILKPKNHNVSIPQYLNIKYIYRIGDAVMISQDSMRYPETSSMSYFGALFHFKRIDSINVNNDYFIINLKKTHQCFLSAEYAVERFKSFNDKEFFNIAENIKSLNDESSIIAGKKIAQKQKQQKSILIIPQSDKDIQQYNAELNQMRLFLNQKKNKFAVLIHYKQTQAGLSADQIYISIKLLQQIGFNINQMILQYTRFKNLTFEIFSSEYYKFMFQKLCQKSVEIMKKKRLGEQVSPFKYQVVTAGSICRTKIINGIQWEEKVKAKITFEKLTPHLSGFEIEDIQEIEPAISCIKKKRTQDFSSFNQLQTMQLQVKSIQLSKAIEIQQFNNQQLFNQ